MMMRINVLNYHTRNCCGVSCWNLALISVLVLVTLEDFRTDEHFNHLLRVLKYLESTSKMKLYFTFSKEDLTTFGDAD